MPAFGRWDLAALASIFRTFQKWPAGWQARRLFAWYEEAGGLRATEETDSDRRRRRRRRMVLSLLNLPPYVQQVPLLVLFFSFLSCFVFFVIVFVFLQRRENRALSVLDSLLFYSSPPSP